MLFKWPLTAPSDHKENLLQEFTYKLMTSKHGIIEKILFLLETKQTSTAAKIVLGNIDEFENLYSEKLAGTGMGAPAKSIRVALGALIIKEKLKITDEEAVEQI